MSKRTKKGFTLAELLVVVAIIAVLVAVAIPVFTAELNRARIQTDHANIRAAYALMRTAELTGKITANGTETTIGTGGTTFYFTKAGELTTANTDAYQLQGTETDTCAVGAVNLSSDSSHAKDNVIVISFAEGDAGAYTGTITLKAKK